MIYIFQGCAAIFKAPCTACQAACTCCKGFCSAWSEFWEPIQKNPLGNYVLGTWVLMACAVAACAWGLTQSGKCTEDDTKQKILLFCAVDLGAAALHAGMAYYMQYQIRKGLGLETEYKDMTAKQIQEKAGAILMYDVPVCFYFMVCPALFGLNCWGFTLGSCGGQQPHLGAAMVMIGWGICAGGYLFCWYCCQCCQGNASKLPNPKKKGPDPASSELPTASA